MNIISNHNVESNLETSTLTLFNTESRLVLSILAHIINYSELFRIIVSYLQVCVMYDWCLPWLVSAVLPALC